MTFKEKIARTHIIMGLFTRLESIKLTFLCWIQEKLQITKKKKTEKPLFISPELVGPHNLNRDNLDYVKKIVDP